MYQPAAVALRSALIPRSKSALGDAWRSNASADLYRLSDNVTPCTGLISSHLEPPLHSIKRNTPLNQLSGLFFELFFTLRPQLTGREH